MKTMELIILELREITEALSGLSAFTSSIQENADYCGVDSLLAPHIRLLYDKADSIESKIETIQKTSKILNELEQSIISAMSKVETLESFNVLFELASMSNQTINIKKICRISGLIDVQIKQSIDCLKEAVSKIFELKTGF